LKEALGDIWKTFQHVRLNIANGENGEAQKMLHEISQKLPFLDAGRRQKYAGLLAEVADFYGLDFQMPPDPMTSNFDLDAFVHHVKEGISLVTCCRNRAENLIKAIPSWLKCSEISEIIIVDWTSDVPVYDDLKRAGIADARIKIFRVEEQSRWILSHAFNAGFRAASFSKILKIDADIILDRDFFAQTNLRKNTFITGNWRLADEGQEYINGFFFVTRKDLLKVNGFNEFITTYGWDDDELYARLKDAGLARVSLGSRFLRHLDHEDTLRLDGDGNGALSAQDELMNSAQFSIIANKFMAGLLPAWNEAHPRGQYSLEADGPGRFRLQSLENSALQVPKHIRDDAEYYAALHILSWKFSDERVLHLDRRELFALLKETSLAGLEGKDVNEIVPVDRPSPPILRRKKRLYIDVQHGLGNRLRAFASAGVIADMDDRELVVIWEPDHHCDCRMGDLLKYDGICLEQGFFHEAQQKGMAVYTYMEAEEGAKKDARIVHTSNQDLYIRSAYVLNSPYSSWAAENIFLKNLTISDEVLDLMSAVRRPNVLGVHVRMQGAKGSDNNSYDRPENWTDEGQELLHYWREKSHFSHFQKRIDGLIEAGAAETIFLAADTPATYDAFAQQYGGRVARLQRNLFDRSKHQIQYGLADVLLLSECKHFLGSSWSSFSELALRLSGGFDSVEMSGRDF